MNKVTRGEKLLQKMVDNNVLTPHGRDFLIAALDPMHDTQLQNLSGWPDIADQPSVVRTVKRSATISAPADQLSNWDCVIRTLPVMNETAVNASIRQENVVVSQSNTFPLQIGAVTICKYATTDGNWAMDDSVPERLIIALPDDIAKGNGRLIGMGFEVNNTTAEIYKQGTATVWRNPQQQAEEQTWYATMVAQGGGIATTAFTGRDVLWGPNTLADAMLLSGSRQWEAKDGAYCVVPFISAENPVQPPAFIEPVLRPGHIDFDDDFRNVNSSLIYFPFLSAQAEGGRTLLLPPLQKWAPVHSAGAAFTGLSKETTLTVTVNFYYEYFPSSRDVALVTLAKPSGSFDPVALELYSKALSELPVGVPAYMNGFGDWFASVVSRFAPTVGTLLSPLMGPGGAAVGLGAKAIADSYLAANTPNTKPRLTSPQQSKKKKQKQVASTNISVARAKRKAPPKK